MPNRVVMMVPKAEVVPPLHLVDHFLGVQLLQPLGHIQSNLEDVVEGQRGATCTCQRQPTDARVGMWLGAHIKARTAMLRSLLPLLAASAPWSMSLNRSCS